MLGSGHVDVDRVFLLRTEQNHQGQRNAQWLSPLCGEGTIHGTILDIDSIVYLTILHSSIVWSGHSMTFEIVVEYWTLTKTFPLLNSK